MSFAQKTMNKLMSISNNTGKTNITTAYKHLQPAPYKKG